MSQKPQSCTLKKFNDHIIYISTNYGGVFKFSSCCFILSFSCKLSLNTYVTHFCSIQQYHISMWRILVIHCNIVKTNTNRSLRIRNKIEAFLVNDLPDLLIVTFSHWDAKSAPFKIKTTAKMCLWLKC